MDTAIERVTQRSSFSSMSNRMSIHKMDNRRNTTRMDTMQLSSKEENYRSLIKNFFQDNDLS